MQVRGLLEEDLLQHDLQAPGDILVMISNFVIGFSLRVPEQGDHLLRVHLVG